MVLRGNGGGDGDGHLFNPRQQRVRSGLVRRERGRLELRARRHVGHEVEALLIIPLEADRHSPACTNT